MSASFRAGVGIVLVRERNQVLAFERAHVPGAWQFPQGGLEDGEEPLEAMWRELREETGLTAKDVHVVAEVPEWLGYELPRSMRSTKTGRGQVHRWYLVRPVNDDLMEQLDLSQASEFRATRWMSIEELIRTAAEFRRPVYNRLATFIEQHLAER